jgi:AcrR family transcriptional regulator
MSASATGIRSTAQARRPAVVARAVEVFARSGYHATAVTEVAEAAGISQAYVFRLFKGKLGLFVAALEHCYEQVELALAEGADRVSDGSAEQILAAMGDAYAELVADRDLLMLQVHAQSASDVPEIREAQRQGLRRIVEFVAERSGAQPPQVQAFVTYGLLCHLIVTADLDQVDAAWARTLTAGMRHPERQSTGATRRSTTSDEASDPRPLHEPLR